MYFGPKLEKGPGGNGGGDHFANFVKAVKARDPKLLNADIEEGHLSSAYCHLGNIAYRLGRKLHVNPSTESFVNDSEADCDADPRIPRAFRRADQGVRRARTRSISESQARLADLESVDDRHADTLRIDLPVAVGDCVTFQEDARSCGTCRSGARADRRVGRP